ncbi:MAG: hypothetical protein E6G50_04630 [Actinobacteria bacterium]|nr:MAG: hypothetical protein E6G50_04630 [Actinomycetota bacterium]
MNVWRARLVITADEVIIAGVTRTHHVPLDQVEGFEPRVVRSGMRANGTPTIVLLRRTAAPIGIYALKREGFVWNFKKTLRELDSAAAELNATLAKARAGAEYRGRR